MNPDSDLLGSQLEYYRARAPEYDEWWLRRGRYDRGAAVNSQWAREGAAVAAALTEFQPSGLLLELACGTGIWTEKLLPFATHLTAIDGSAETLAINARRLGVSPRVRYVEGDLFQWRPSGRYDTVFFSFWLSHVPASRFDAFWEFVAACLAPGGRVFFLDSLRDPSSTAVDNFLPVEPTTTLRRRLNDGREFEIVKVFYEPDSLASRLRARGWQTEVRCTEHYFFHGVASRRPTPATRT